MRSAGCPRGFRTPGTAVGRINLGSWSSLFPCSRPLLTTLSLSPKNQNPLLAAAGRCSKYLELRYDLVCLGMETRMPIMWLRLGMLEAVDIRPYYTGPMRLRQAPIGIFPESRAAARDPYANHEL